MRRIRRKDVAFCYSNKRILVQISISPYLPLHRRGNSIESRVKRWTSRRRALSRSKEWKSAFPEEGSSTQGSANPRSDSRCSFFRWPGVEHKRVRARLNIWITRVGLTRPNQRHIGPGHNQATLCGCRLWGRERRSARRAGSTNV